MKLFLPLLLSLFLFSNSVWANTSPNPSFTPGALCTPSSADFQKFDYPEHIARCNRNIALPEKQEVARNYGNIPESSWSSYEFDHFIPLCAGGANDIANLWPQPISEARNKDQLENQICIAMRAGTLTQAQAVEKVHAWFQNFVDQQVDFKLAGANNSRYLCQSDPSQNRNATSPIKVTFERTGASGISKVRAELIENGNENEIISSGENQIAGKLSKAKTGPLKDMYLFSIKADKDRFDLYLPDLNAEGSGTFQAYFKVSFDGTYPQFDRINCSKLGQ